MRGRDATRRRDVRTLYYTPMSAKDAARTDHAARSAPASENSADAVNAHYDTRLPELPGSRRLQDPGVARAVYGVIFFPGATVRHDVAGSGPAEGAVAS